METPVINCNTIFNTTENTMTQMFKGKIKLVVDFKTQIIALIIDGKIVDKFSFESDYSLQDFERYQQQVINIAENI